MISQSPRPTLALRHHCPFQRLPKPDLPQLSQHVTVNCTADLHLSSANSDLWFSGKRKKPNKVSVSVSVFENAVVVETLEKEISRLEKAKGTASKLRDSVMARRYSLPPSLRHVITRHRREQEKKKSTKSIFQSVPSTPLHPPFPDHKPVNGVPGRPYTEVVPPVLNSLFKFQRLERHDAEEHVCGWQGGQAPACRPRARAESRQRGLSFSVFSFFGEVQAVQVAKVREEYEAKISEMQTTLKVRNICRSRVGVCSRLRQILQVDLSAKSDQIKCYLADIETRNLALKKCAVEVICSSLAPLAQISVFRFQTRAHLFPYFIFKHGLISDYGAAAAQQAAAGRQASPSK